MEGAISLGVGEPDFDTPWHIRGRKAFTPLKRAYVLYIQCRFKAVEDEICNYLKRRFEVSYDPDTEVMVTVGGSEAIALTQQCAPC